MQSLMQLRSSCLDQQFIKHISRIQIILCKSFNFVVSGKSVNIRVEVDVKSFYIVK